jgi:hypothetical protein
MLPCAVSHLSACYPTCFPTLPISRLSELGVV